MRSVVRQIEYGFRHAVVYPLLRLLFRNEEYTGSVDLKSVRGIVILRYDRIGDIIVTTPVFRALKRHNPRLLIGVVASPANAELIADDPSVDRVYVLHRNWLKLIRSVLRARHDRYDVCLNFIFNRTTTGGILANVIVPDGIKIGQGDAKYRFYFNRLVQLPRGSLHMAEVLADYVRQVFGFTMHRDDLAFHIAIDKPSTEQVDRYLQACNLTRRGEESPYLVFNLSATDAVRRLSRAQALVIARFLAVELGAPTIVTSSPADRALRQEVVSEVNLQNCMAFPQEGEATLRQLASLVKGARFIVTPDTSLIHFASAVKTPVVGFFTPLQVAAEWLPFGVQHISIFADGGHPVKDIPPERIKQEITRFARELD